MTISEIHKQLTDKELSCKELVRGFLDEIKKKDKDIHAYLDIGMFFDTAMCSLQIPPDCLALLDNSGLTIEVTCYPCEESKPNN